MLVAVVVVVGIVRSEKVNSSSSMNAGVRAVALHP